MPLPTKEAPGVASALHKVARNTVQRYKLVIIQYTGIVYDNNILFNRQMALMNDGIKR